MSNCAAPPPLDAWGLSGPVQPLHGGHRNTVLRLGDHVLKSTRRTEAAIAWLVPICRAAARFGLAVPAPIASRSGSLVVDGWTCEPFVDGVPTPPNRVASAMRDLHIRLRSHPQRPGFASARDLCTIDAGGDVDLSDMPPPLVTALRAVWATLPAERTVIHGDLNPSNILTDANGTPHLIDWDEARSDAATFDLATWSHTPTPRAVLAWEIACCWHIEPERARRLAQQFTD
ncbi:phosphotransferase [uncultured Tateyamaria sp.]|uniref:phosphotransferase enzyme family protein n=1 Tax=uncultured Tateyamaria sp. TaxID=455651 RepID=UPI00260F2FC0|nr:phosphotransferase [uncultured Tateyamaria sp.]